MSEETYSSVFFIIIVVPFLTWALIVFLCFLYFLFEKCGRWFEIRYGRHLVVETDNNADHTESTLLQSLYAALFVQTSPFVLKTKKFSVYRQGGETTTNTPRPQDHEKIDQCAICLESFEDEDTIGISSSLAPDRCPHIFTRNVLRRGCLRKILALPAGGRSVPQLMRFGSMRRGLKKQPIPQPQTAADSIQHS
jgi:hypothetical protein